MAKTKLDAVNEMLSVVGEDPVSSLDTTNAADALQAINILNGMIAEILTVGWHCNTDTMTIPPDTNGWFSVGPDVLRIDTVGETAAVDAVVRTDPNDGLRKLWDIQNFTFVFTVPLTLQIIRELQLDDCTPPLRAYITARAAERYAARTLGSDNVDAKVKRDVTDTWAQLVDAESQEEPSSLMDNPEINYGRVHYRALNNAYYGYNPRYGNSM